MIEELAAAATRSVISKEPAPVGPWGYAAIAVLIGMGAGVVCAPWLESWYRKFR
jgi:hypothetical protein